MPEHDGAVTHTHTPVLSASTRLNIFSARARCAYKPS